MTAASTAAVAAIAIDVAAPIAAVATALPVVTAAGAAAYWLRSVRQSSAVSTATTGSFAVSTGFSTFTAVTWLKKEFGS